MDDWKCVHVTVEKLEKLLLLSKAVSPSARNTFISTAVKLPAASQTFEFPKSSVISTARLVSLAYSSSTKSMLINVTLSE